MHDEEDLSDSAIVRAARRRLLAQLEERAQAHQIINNFAGGASPSAGRSSGIQERLAPQNDNYGVIIKRRPYYDKEGKVAGWDKSVERTSKFPGHVRGARREDDE